MALRSALRSDVPGHLHYRRWAVGAGCVALVCEGEQDRVASLGQCSPVLVQGAGMISARCCCNDASLIGPGLTERITPSDPTNTEVGTPRSL